jgi:hypothetical protein
MEAPTPAGYAPPAAPVRWYRDRTTQAALFLVALAIALPELLTGSTPVVSLFLNPLSLPFLLGLYGAGVLLVREATVRWRAGWPAVLLLGAAYGILEEGPGTKTFFDPRVTSAAGPLTQFGHAFGVNWTWVVFITVFHALFSIALPILLTGLAFPESRGRPLVRDRTLGWLLLAYLLTLGLMFVLFDGAYRPAPAVLALFLAIVAALVGLARAAPICWPFETPRIVPMTPRRAGYLGGLWVFLWFGTFWLGPMLLRNPLVLVLVGTLVSVLLGLALCRGVEGGEPRFRLALASGLVSFLILFSGIVTVLGDYLAIGVGLAVVLLLWKLRARLRDAALPDGLPPGVTLSPTDSP